MTSPRAHPSAHQNHTGELSGPELHAVAGPTRCSDPFAWQLRVRDAGDLALKVNGRTEVGHRTVKMGLLWLATYADGISGRTPGGNIRPGLERMTVELGVSRRTALAIVRAGIEHGYLVQTAAGHRGRRAEFALALPAEPVDNPPERVRALAPNPEKGCEPSHERVRAVARKGASARTPTSALPPQDLLPHAREPRQLPLVHSLPSPGEEEEDGQRPAAGPDPAVELARRVGLPIGRPGGQLHQQVSRLLAAGWTLDDLAAHPAVARPLPDQLHAPAALLAARLEDLAQLPPPAIERRRRRAELEATLTDPPDPRPGRPAGPTVHLDELRETGG